MFYGQEKILERLYGYAQQIKRGELIKSFLFVGPSGYGKTTLARIFCTWINKKYSEQIAKEEVGILNPFVDIHVIDEIHLLRNPEPLYPAMEKKIFIFMTNYEANLLEPLKNRCITLRMERYTKENLKQMVKDKFISLGYSIPDSLCEVVGEESNLIPRVAVDSLVVELVNIFKMKGVLPKTEREIKELLFYYLGIKDGMDQTMRDYLTVLERNRSASLSVLCSSLNVQQKYILESIEPILLKKGLIEISSRGRKLKENYVENL